MIMAIKVLPTDIWDGSRTSSLPWESSALPMTIVTFPALISQPEVYHE